MRPESTASPYGPSCDVLLKISERDGRYVSWKMACNSLGSVSKSPGAVGTRTSRLMLPREKVRRAASNSPRSAVPREGSAGTCSVLPWKEQSRQVH